MSLFDILESSIDYPQKDLPFDVWLKSSGSYVLQPQNYYKLLHILQQFPDLYLTDIASKGDGNYPEVHIVGSLCTNLYTNESDLDLHIVVSEDSEYFGNEQFQEYVRQWFNDNRDEIGGYIGSHPVEVYMQYDRNQDHLSDGCYVLFTGKWISGPKIVGMNYDPYEDYSHVMKEVSMEAGQADQMLGELKRDVIDYDTIKAALAQMDGESKKKLMDRLQSKLEEIEQDIERLYSKRKFWVDLRRDASKPSSPEQAKEDVELVKKWNDKNAVSKYLSRYQYMRLIGELADLMDEEGEIEDKEVDKVKDIIGVE
jgi:hypothetical protein